MRPTTATVPTCLRCGAALKRKSNHRGHSRWGFLGDSVFCGALCSVIWHAEQR